MAVLLRAVRKPMKIDCLAGRPRPWEMAAATSRVSRTCRVPPSRAVRRSCTRFRKENSRPIVKSRATTPISASIVTASRLPTSLNP